MIEVERKVFRNDVQFEAPVTFTAEAEFGGAVSFTDTAAFASTATFADTPTFATAPVTVGELGGATITVGAEDANVVNVAIQLTDRAGTELATRASLMAYLSDDANGDSVAGTAPDTVAIGTDGLAIPLVAGKCFLLTSEADGDIDIDITEDGTDTWYLILVMPDGSLVASGAITTAA